MKFSIMFNMQNQNEREERRGKAYNVILLYVENIIDLK